MNNIKVRVELTKRGVKYWQLARLLGISVPTLNRRLRDELPADEQEKIVELIREHGGGGEHDNS
jgi:hypothetical protein